MHFALLAFEVLFGVADVALGHPLGLVDDVLVHREIASVEQHFAAMQLRYAVHPVEQHPVVTDQQQASGEVIERVIQPVPRIDVEVVGRLVEQEHVGLFEQLRSQPERDDLAAGQRAEATVEVEVAQA